MKRLFLKPLLHDIEGEIIARAIELGMARMNSYKMFITEGSLLRLLEALEQIGNHTRMIHERARLPNTWEPHVSYLMSQRAINYHVRYLYTCIWQVRNDRYTHNSVNWHVQTFIIKSFTHLHKILSEK